MDAGTYVRSIFFGDSLAFSVPLREQPGQPHHGRAHPGSLGGIPTPVGVGIPQAHLQVGEPFYIFYSHRGEVHPVWSFRSGTLHYTFQAEAQLLAVTSDCYGRRKPGSHTNPSSSFRVVIATARDPRLWSTKGEGGCARWAECVTSPLGQGCAC